ncbi:MAG TPA: ATP-binding cassette domain-containing protein, partial [Niastella sp.]
MTKQDKHIDRTKQVIAIRDLYKSFGTNHVLRGIDLDLYQGENVVVLGRSGTGKSVLIKIIAGLLKPDKGSVNVLGNEVTNISYRQLEQLRLRIGFSFQSSALYDSMKVRENLEFPLLRNSKHLSGEQVNQAVEKALEAVGLSQTINQ